MPDRLTEQQVRDVARLGRLALTDEEVHRMAGQLSAVLGHFAELSEVDVEGVEPMAHALDMSNVLREDAARPGLPVAVVLANAPAKSPPFFQVPKVLGEGSGA